MWTVVGVHIGKCVKIMKSHRCTGCNEVLSSNNFYKRSKNNYVIQPCISCIKFNNNKLKPIPNNNFKICITCGFLKKITDFNKYKRKLVKGNIVVYVQSICKQCKSRKVNERRIHS